MSAPRAVCSSSSLFPPPKSQAPSSLSWAEAVASQPARLSFCPSSVWPPPCEHRSSSGMAVSQGVSDFRASGCFQLHSEHNPAPLAWLRASDPGLKGAFAPFPSPLLVLALMPPSPAPAAPGFWHPRASPVQGLNLLLPFSASSSSPPPSLLAVPRAL